MNSINNIKISSYNIDSYLQYSIKNIAIRFVITMLISVIFICSILVKSNAAVRNDYEFTNTKIVNEINKVRKNNKLKTLKEDSDLSKLAEKRLDDMIENNYFSHISPSGNDIDTLLIKSNYNFINRGENLAYGEFVNESDIVNSWINSKWHKYNILYKTFNRVGTASRVAEFKGDKYLIVAQVFGDIDTKLAKR